MHEHHFVQVGLDVISIQGTLFHHLSTEVYLDHASFSVKFRDYGAPHFGDALGMLDMNEKQI